MWLSTVFGLLADRRHAHRQPARAFYQRRLRVESLENRLALATVMEVQVEATDLEGNPISEVEFGEEFLLVATVQDLRSQPTGVFAAYVDILYNSSLAAVNGPITHATMYRNGPDGDTSTPGLIDDAGGFFAFQDCQSFPCHGDGDQELLFSVPFVALASGTVTFDVGEPDDPTPVHDALVFGSNDPVAVEDIVFLDDTLEITAPTPTELVTELLADLDEMEIEDGFVNSLEAKLNGALSAFNEENVEGGIEELNAFINAVQAQRGKKISEGDADFLIASATSIIDMARAELSILV
jgi:hypothetical protein